MSVYVYNVYIKCLHLVWLYVCVYKVGSKKIEIYFNVWKNRTTLDQYSDLERQRQRQREREWVSVRVYMFVYDRFAINNRPRDECDEGLNLFRKF